MESAMIKQVFHPHTLDEFNRAINAARTGDEVRGGIIAGPDQLRITDIIHPRAPGYICDVHGDMNELSLSTAVGTYEVHESGKVIFLPHYKVDTIDLGQWTHHDFQPNQLVMLGDGRIATVTQKREHHLIGKCYALTWGLLLVSPGLRAWTIFINKPAAA